MTRIPSSGRHLDTSAWQTRTRNCTPGEAQARPQHRAQRRRPWGAPTNFGINYEYLRAGNEPTGPHPQDSRTAGWTGKASIHHCRLRRQTASGPGRGPPRVHRTETPARAGVIRMITGPGDFRLNRFCAGTFLNKQTENLAAEPGLVGQTDPPSPRCSPTLRAACSRLPTQHGPWEGVCMASRSPFQSVFHFGNANIKQSPAPGGTEQAVPFPATPRSGPNREKQ